MRIAVIIPAAGSGTRFRAGDDAGAVDMGLAQRSKVEVDLAGRPIFQRAIECFTGRADVAQILIAVAPDQLDAFRLRWADKLGFLGVKIVPGGKVERWETVMRAIEAIDVDCTHIAVHDAVRPLADKALIDRVFEAAARFDAVVPGIAVVNTLKRVGAAIEPDADGGDPLASILGSAGRPTYEARRIEGTVDRKGLVQVQTPQVFKAALLREAYQQVAAGRVDARSLTDDAGLIEQLGHEVVVVEGDAINLKVTTPADLRIVQALVQSMERQQTHETARRRLFGDDDE